MASMSHHWNFSFETTFSALEPKLTYNYIHIRKEQFSIFFTTRFALEPQKIPKNSIYILRYGVHIKLKSGIY